MEDMLRFICLRIVILFWICSILSIFAQTNFVNVSERIYDYLDRISLKGVINTNQFLKPLSRNEIASYIAIINGKKNELNPIEREELEWFISEFGSELEKEKFINSQRTKNILEKDDWDRFRIFSYRDENFRIVAAPSLSITFTSQYGTQKTHRKWGFSAYGNINKNVSFQMSFRDNTEFGEKLDIEKRFNDETGPIRMNVKKTSFDYSYTNGSILFSNDWIAFGGVKENINLGSGYRSQLILSSKAPSFPTIYLSVKPVDWLNFFYLHGWLLSRVEDTSKTYVTQIPGRDRRIDRDKYFVMHALQIKPWECFSISMGETVIYSDVGVYWGYLIPFLFFRSVDHMFEGGGGGNSGNNGSLFFDVNYKYKNIRFYSTLFIDELSVNKLLKGSSDRNQFGFTFGTSFYDIGIPSLMSRIEYTRILPWVYSNFVQTQTYTNSNYLLGHYIGQNADQLFLQLDYRILRGLEMKLWGEFIRRGGFEEVTKQYTDPGEPFLYGLRRNETNLGFEVSYEYIHDLFVKGFYQYSNITDEDIKRTPGFMLGANHSFGISLGYGL